MMKQIIEKAIEAFDFLGKSENQKAVDKLSSVIKPNPHLACSHVNKASVCLQLQEPAMALSDCDRAIKLHPSSAQAYKFQGGALQLLGHLKEAACNISYLELEQQLTGLQMELLEKAQQQALVGLIK